MRFAGTQQPAVVGQASHAGHWVHVPRVEPLCLGFHLGGIPAIAEPGHWYEPCFELQYRGQLGFPDSHETNAIKVESVVPVYFVVKPCTAAGNHSLLEH